MELLQALGITGIFWFQLIIAFITILLLTLFIFEPFFEGYQSRLNVTEGVKSRIDQKKPVRDQLFKEYADLLSQQNREIESLRQRLQNEFQQQWNQEESKWQARLQQVRQEGQERLRQWESEWEDRKAETLDLLKKLVLTRLLG